MSIDGLSIQWLHLNEAEAKKDISWSKRLRLSLERIDTEYVLCMLEDFFLREPVRADMIERCIKWLDDSPDAAVVYFYPLMCEDIVVHQEFSPVDRKCAWAVSGDCGLWRKSALLGLLRDENPWEFETYGTYRWRRTKYKLYTHRKEFAPIIKYQFETDCGDRSAIIQGKWLPCIPEFLSSQGIDVNYEERGFADTSIYVSKEREKNWLLHDIKESLTSFTALKHYSSCFIKTMKAKMIPIKAFLFHR